MNRGGIYNGPDGPLHGDGIQVGTPIEKPKCSRCNGSGVIQGRPTTFETDSKEEIALAWEMARYPCPECNK